MPVTRGEMKQHNDESLRGHIGGLDTIRFICALWVVMGHYGAPPLPGFVDKSNIVGLITLGVYNNLTSGPAAVIVFFVISGLCIHYPYARELRNPDVVAYLARRYIRIVLPMAAAITIAQWADVRLALFQQTILWSLLAELVYYTLYPVLLWLRRQLNGWTPIILIAYVAALMVVATDPSAGDYPSYGVYLNWVLGIPCWLLGCVLAEKLCQVPDRKSAPFIWLWRFGILILATICSIARFHSPIGYPWTLDFFAIAAAAWVFREAIYFRSIAPPRILEWAGGWSYSLYLVHAIAGNFLRKMLVGQFASLLGWCMLMSFVLLSSFVFALIFEFPSHKLAKYVARWIRGGKVSARASTERS